MVLPGGASLHSVYGENSKSRFDILESRFDILENCLDSKREHIIISMKR